MTKAIAVMLWVAIAFGLLLNIKECSAQTTAIPDGLGGYTLWTPGRGSTQIIRNPVGLGYTIWTPPFYAPPIYAPPAYFGGGSALGAGLLQGQQFRW